MSVLFIALPVALLIAGAFVGGFIYAVKTGQFDDLDTPPMRMLFDDMEVKKESKQKPAETEEDS